MKKVIGLYFLFWVSQLSVDAQTHMPQIQDAVFYTVQLQALSKELPPDHFDGLQGVWMRKDADGLFKYYHGRYASEKEARTAVATLKRKGFSDVWMVSSNRFIMGNPVLNKTKKEVPKVKTVQAKQPVEKPDIKPIVKNSVAKTNIIPDSRPVIRPEDIKEGMIWTVQLSAFKYPVYLNFFDPLKDIMEFQGSDKYFKYCIGKYTDYDKAHIALEEYKRMGYDKAFVVDYEKYLPYLIE